VEQGRRGPSTSPPGRDPPPNRGRESTRRGRAGHRRCPDARNARQGSVRSAKHVESRAGTVAVIAIRSNPTRPPAAADKLIARAVLLRPWWLWPRIAFRVVRLSEQLAGPFSGSPPCSLAPGCACWPRLVRSALRGSGPVADRCRPAPACATRRSSDRWSADRQRLGNGTASSHQIEHLTAELLGITLRHGHGSFDGRRDQKSNKPTPYNPGRISLRTSRVGSETDLSQIGSTSPIASFAPQRPGNQR
jgi:hypothetical protein